MIDSKLSPTTTLMMDGNYSLLSSPNVARSWEEYQPTEITLLKLHENDTIHTFYRRVQDLQIKLLYSRASTLIKTQTEQIPTISSLDHILPSETINEILDTDLGTEELPVIKALHVIPSDNIDDDNITHTDLLDNMNHPPYPHTNNKHSSQSNQPSISFDMYPMLDDIEALTSSAVVHIHTKKKLR